MIGMVMSFGSLAASIWVMVDPYIKHGAKTYSAWANNTLLHCQGIVS
jgi:hypothetical protein